MMAAMWLLLAAGQAGQAEPAAARQTEVEGAIVKVLVGEAGNGPRLVIRPARASPGEEWTIWLGSFRYLMAQDFNPKAGQTVSVRGAVRGAREMVASAVTVRETGRTLVLRDSEGRPVWRGRFKQR